VGKLEIPTALYLGILNEETFLCLYYVRFHFLSKRFFLKSMALDLPVISMFLSVSTIESIISSGMCFNLLFCRLRVSSELRFSKACGDIALMLKEE
jgi:hypothetical protein